jgi:hypothetical protein
VCGGRRRCKIPAIEKCEVPRAGPVKRRNIHDAVCSRRPGRELRAGHARNLVKRETRGLS